MKTITKAFSVLPSVLAATLYSPLLLADTSDIYFGLDLLKTTYSTQENYGRNIFKKNPPALNAFIGYELPRNFFLEAGYEVNTKRGRTDRNNEGAFYPGTNAPNDAGDWQEFNTKIKISHPSLGVGMRGSFFPNTDFFVLAGLSLTKVRASLEQTIDTNTGLVHQYTPAERAASIRNFIKRKVTPMLRAGVSYAVTNNFSFRLTGTWRKLGNFKCKTDTENSIAEIRLKNGYSVGLGLSYNI